MLLLGVIGVSLLIALAVADVARYVAAGVEAATAADAAALAAAPVTFRAFGSDRGPSAEASRFAEANGASLITCRCAIDRSWSTRTVEVIVERSLHLILLGTRTVRAVGRGEFLPARLH